MKKIYTSGLVIFLLMTTSLMSQNLVLNGDLETWENSTTPASWGVYESISQESLEVYQGAFAAAHTSADGTQDFRQDLNGIIGGQEYVISYYYKDNDPQARHRIWSYWMQDGTYLDDHVDELRPSVYSTDNPEWQHYNVTLAAPLNANQFRFEVRVYKQDGSFGGKVYYDDFSFEQNQTFYPEPSNYPTEFSAEVVGQSIALSWQDATGDQLPTAYLIVGELLAVKNMASEIPVDGIPVADDFDWSDNIATANVLYGQQSYTFSDLGPNVYEFTIYPYTNSGANIDYKTDGTPPTAGGSVGMITAVNEEGFENGLGTWTPYNVLGAQEWYQDVFNDQTFAKMSGFDGASFANEDWLISPQLNLAEFTTAYFNFISAMNYTGPDLQLFVSLDYTGSGDPNGYSWTELTNQAAWSGGNWSWVASGEIDLEDYQSASTYLAFKYTSTDVESATWELDDLYVYGVTNVGVQENMDVALQLYPNPASNSININVNDAGMLSITNLLGQEVQCQTIEKGQSTVSLQQLETGIYVVRFIDVHHRTATQKLFVR